MTFSFHKVTSFNVMNVGPPEIFMVNPLTGRTKTCNENEFKRFKQTFY